MSTISDYTETATPQVATLNTPLIVVADTFQATDLHDGSIHPHCFLGVAFYLADGTSVATPTGGTFAVAVRTSNSPETWDTPPVSSIDATAPVTIDFAANVIGIRLIPTGISGGSVISYRVTMTRNRS